MSLKLYCHSEDLDNETTAREAKEWIRSHRGDNIGDTPLWVLIGLGIGAMLEESEE